MNYHNIMLALFCLLTQLLLAQSEPQQIRLLDIESGMPIAKANFEYGENKGVSDAKGVIELIYEEGTPLELYHENYGTWTLSDEAVQAALHKEVTYKRPHTVNLYPVTIIAVKPQGPQPEEEINMQYQDRLQHDAANILNQTPAFNSIRKGGNYGFEPVFRGFKYDQLNIVMNGAQSATAACPNRMDPPTSQMAPNMMDRIEILKGPHALRYGAGIGATINFIPAKLRFSDQPNTYGRLSSGYETNGNLVRGESQLGFSGNKYDINFFASWSQGDDYTTGNEETVQADFQRGSFGTNIGLQLADNQQLRLSALYNRARDADFPALPMDLREDDTWMFNARHDIQFQDKHLQSWNTTLFGSFVDHLMDNRRKPLDPRMLNAETHATTYNYGGRTEGIWKLGKHKLYAGADLRVEGADGTRVREFLRGPMAGNTLNDNAWQDGRISKTALFMEYQINGKALAYVLSGRMEMNAADINEATPEFSQVYPETQTTQFNPSVSLGILKDLGNHMQAGLWLARAQRSGSLTERYINYFPVGQDPFEMLGNPQLDPETNYQADLTFKWNMNENSVINVDVYAAYLQNYISSIIDTTLTPRLPRSPGVRQFINIDEAFKTGFEVSWEQQLLPSISHRMGLAYTYGQDLEREQALPEIAPLDIRYSLLGSYLDGRLQPELAFRHVAQQSRVSSEFGETVTPAFNVLDFQMGYQVNSRFSFTVAVNNLLDENYYEHLNRAVRGSQNAIFAPGRNFAINMNFIL